MAELSWKTPRLSKRGRQGIAVRTKWQSGHRAGNGLNGALKGNRLSGNGRQRRGKSYPNLSRKIYPVCRRHDFFAAPAAKYSEVTFLHEKKD